VIHTLLSEFVENGHDVYLDKWSACPLMMLHDRHKMSYSAIEEEMHATSLKEDSSLGRILLYTQIRSLPARGMVNDLYLCRQQFMMTRW
jgi:hypothetical protein